MQKKEKLLGAKIKKIRELVGKTQEETATALHITTQAYSRIERGEVSVTVERMEQIAAVFKVSSEQILSFDLGQILAREAQIPASAEQQEPSQLLGLLADIVNHQYLEIQYLREEIRKLKAQLDTQK